VIEGANAVKGGLAVQAASSFHWSGAGTLDRHSAPALIGRRGERTDTLAAPLW